MKYLYHGAQSTGPGRKKKYAGKVDWDKPDLRRFKLRETLDDGTQLYSAVVGSVAFKCNIHLVYLVKTRAGKRCYTLLFSTDLDLGASDIYRFYSARFQIEFIFRDARQFTGMNDSQARNPEALDTQVNASLTALNLAKATLRPAHLRDLPIPFSLASLKRRALNEHLLERFIYNFDLDPSLIKSHPNWSNLCQYGTIAS